MMDYISKLNEKEIRIVCEIIGPKGIKWFFQGNSKLFNRIKPGFRAVKLSDEQAIQLIIKNISEPIISSYINQFIFATIQVIQKKKAELIKEGKDVATALPSAISDSCFSNNIDLYFKLVYCNEHNYSIPEELIVLIQKGIQSVSDEDEESELEVQAAEEEIVKLTNQLQDCQMEHEAERESYTQKQTELTNKIASLSAALDETKAELKRTSDKLAAANITIKEQNTQLKKRKEPERDSADFIEENYEYTSLCMVSEPDYTNNNQIWLIRLADIFKGKMESFFVNEDLPRFFGNRDRLFWNDGPSKIGYIGVWNWNAIPNLSDPTRDYVTTAYDASIEPAEIIELKMCSTVEEILEALQHGVDVIPSCKQVLFTASLPKGRNTGLLCSDKQLNIDNNRTYLLNNVFVLKQYNFLSQDIFRVNGKAFYRKLDIGEPERTMQVKDPLEAVKEIILHRATWNEFKQRGTVKSTWRTFREFLTEMCSTPVYQEIAEKCGCDEDTAKEYIDLFIQRAASYLDSTDVEDNVLAAAIENHVWLLERCNKIVEETWKTENFERIEKVEKELHLAQKAVERKKAELAQCKSELSDVQKKLTTINAAISEREKFAQSVEDKVATKISEARKNAADFISEMAFQFPTMVAEPSSVKAISHGGPISYHEGMNLDFDTLEECSTWQDMINIIAEELTAAGVSAKYNHGLAAYMYSAYVNETPLLFAGPCGQEIADAFSASLFGKTAAYINCIDGYNTEYMSAILANDEPIIVLNSPFGSDWIARIPNILMTKGKYFILTHPFTEDLLIEPRSLFNYCLPVMTEPFIDTMPEQKYIGGRMSDSFAYYQKKKAKPFHNRLLQSMCMSTLTKARLQQLLTDMHIIASIETADNDCLFGLFPYAFISGNIEIFREKLQAEDQKDMPVSKELRMMLLSFVGEDV